MRFWRKVVRRRNWPLLNIVYSLFECQLIIMHICIRLSENSLHAGLLKKLATATHQYSDRGSLK
jgi:hypothetical protein